MNAKPKPWQVLSDTYREKGRGDQAAKIHARYNALNHTADAISDDLASAIIEKRVKRSDFETALAHGIAEVEDAAPELVAFMASATSTPQWLDMESVARGAQIFRKIPPLTVITHGTITGFYYAAILPDSAIPLSLNRNLVTSSHKRLIETFKYVADMTAPSGIAPYSTGFKTANRVRLVHGFVRSEIRKHYNWNFDAYLEPVNHGGVLFTALLGGVNVVPYAEASGMRFSDQDKADLTMHSAYSALLQGVPPEMIPITFDEARDFCTYYLDQGGLPLPEDRECAMSVLRPLVNNGFPIGPSKIFGKMFHGYLLEETWRIFGKDICISYEIPRHFFARFYAPLFSISNRMIAFMSSNKLLRSLGNSISNKYWDEMVPAMLKEITGNNDTNFSGAAKVKAN